MVSGAEASPSATDLRKSLPGYTRREAWFSILRA